MERYFGCGAFLGVVLIAALVYLYVKPTDAPDFVYQKALKVLKPETLARLPAGYSKEAAEALFDQALDRLKSGDFQQTKFENLKKNLAKALKDNKLQSREIELLLQDLESFVNSG